MKLKTIGLFLFILFGVYLSDAKAVSYGYSQIVAYQPDPASATRVYAETGTVLDFDVWYYYDPGIRGRMFENNYQIAATNIIMEYNSPEISVWIDLTANYGSRYKIHGDHYLGAFFSYVSGGQRRYVDYFGFNRFAGVFPTPYSFSSGQIAYYNYQIYLVATTEISILINRPLRLDSIDMTGGVPGSAFLTTIRGGGFFGNGNGENVTQTVQVSGSGVTATVQPTSPNTIEVLDVQFEIANNAQVGDRNLTLTVNGRVSNSIVFRIGDRTPQITNITPPEGNTGDQVAVTISGSGFGLNPLIQINGTGVNATTTSATANEINAIFSVADATYIGTRGVKVVSRGISGSGFILIPGSSDNSNTVPFNVITNPVVTIPDIGSIEKGSVKTITARVENAPAGHVTKFKFKNKPSPTVPCPATGCITGEARFENGTPQGATEISFNGDGDHQIQIRGWQRSSSTNNVDLEARFNNDSSIRREKSFTVSSVEFVEDAECVGFDNVEFKRGNDSTTYLYVPRGGSSRVKAKIVPSGATGNFKLEVQGGNGITVSPATISSTNAQVLTVTATATADRDMVGIHAKANNNNSLTSSAELLFPHALKRKNKEIKIFKVKEDNDDVQAIPVGQGAPNQTAFIILNGLNGRLDTSPQGDDVIGITPYYERPPTHRNNPKLFRIKTGLNGILETSVQGDDGQYIPTSLEERILYAPITEAGEGLGGAICVTRGVNNFLDTYNRNGDDEEIPDPSNSALKLVSAGTNGRCQTQANQTDLPASNPPNITAIQNYVNARWGNEANVFFTVNPITEEVDVNYDLDRDRKLRVPDPITNANNEEFNSMIQTASSNTINMYWVGVDFTRLDVLGAASPNSSNSWFGSHTLANEDRAFYTIAHEMGHAIGRSGHSSENPLALEYQRDLMYYALVEGATFNQCRVRQPDWDLVNTDR